MIHFPVTTAFLDEESIPSPALLVFPDVIQHNIAKALEIAGNAKRLRPHIKTHKMPQVIRMHLDLGISKFKCSTPSELKMAAEAGAADLLLAYPVVGPTVKTVFDFIHAWPGKRIGVLVDNIHSTKLLEKNARLNKIVLPTYVDIDAGMKRTGIRPGPEAYELYTYIDNSRHLEPAGLHVYDGHIRESDPVRRESICTSDFEGVLKLKQSIESAGLAIPELVCGGSPTFPLHAGFSDRTLSPGTYVLWDYTYSQSLPDLDFEHAAWLLTRVISKPCSNRLCLDLGHKAVASEMKQPRIAFAELETFEVTCHNEEHLVIETEKAGDFEVGDTLHGIPYHICPTVALHDRCYIVRNDHLAGTWDVVARTRII